MLGEAGGVESTELETFAASQLPFVEGGKPTASLRGPGLGGEGKQQLLPVPETAPPAPPLPQGAPLLPVAVVVGSPLDVKLCVAFSGRGYLERCWFGVDGSSSFSLISI